MAREVERKLIELRAYRIWEEEGRPDGRHEQHWEQARTQLEQEAEGFRDSAEAFESLPGAVKPAARAGGARAGSSRKSAAVRI